MAILRLSWRGRNNRKKYFLQHICVIKDCFYPKKVLGMQFLHFWSISQRSKFWLKFPLKTCVFRYGSVFNVSWGVPDETKSWFLQIEQVKKCQQQESQGKQFYFQHNNNYNTLHFDTTMVSSSGVSSGTLDTDTTNSNCEMKMQIF